VTNREIESLDDLPAVLTTRDIVGLSKLPRWLLTRLMRRAGATKRGRIYVISIERLMDKEPDLARSIVAALERKRLKQRLPPDQTASGRLAVISARQDSNDARVRAVEADLRKLRAEIRKVRWRIAKCRARPAESGNS